MRTHILLIRHFTIVVRADAHARINKVSCKQAIDLVFIALLENNSLSLTDEIKAYKINDNVLGLSTDKSEELILLRDRIKYLESENKFLKDNIVSKQKLIDKLLENNNKLVDHQFNHVSVQYIKGSQSGPVTAQ